MVAKLLLLTYLAMNSVKMVAELEIILTEFFTSVIKLGNNNSTMCVKRFRNLTAKNAMVMQYSRVKVERSSFKPSTRHFFHKPKFSITMSAECGTLLMIHPRSAPN